MKLRRHNKTSSDPSRRTPWYRRTAGFTLVEMMIALVLFGVGLVALAQALPSGLSVRDRARRLSVATNFAQEELERLRSLPFTHADLAGGSHTDPDSPIDGRYSRAWVVQDDNPIPGMKRVAVTVSFPTASPDSQAVITTLISR